jgi:hypothetical protein
VADDLVGGEAASGVCYQQTYENYEKFTHRG